MKVVKIRCPLCGKWAWQGHVNVSEVFDSDLALVEFGGSVSAPEKRHQKQRGLLKWTRFNEPTLYASVKKAIFERLTRLVEGFGYRLIPIEFVSVSSQIMSDSYVEGAKDWIVGKSRLVSQSQLI